MTDGLQVVHDGLDYLYGELDKMGLRYFPTQGNFFLIDVSFDIADGTACMFQCINLKGSIPISTGY